MQQFLFVQSGAWRPALLTKQARGWLLLLLALLGSTASVLAQPTYCNGTSLGGGNTGSITSVSIASTPFSNSTFSTPPAGSYYTSYPVSVTTATLQPGATYSFTVNLSATYSAVLWIDYNQNGVFDTSEGVQVLSTTTGGTTGTASFTVPVTATAGATGLRIRTRLTGNTNDPSTSCLLYGSGETQDYVVTIAAGAPCTSPPTPGTATATPANVCPGTTTTLTLTGASFGAGLTYQWQSSTTSATAGFTNIAGATNSSYTTPALTQTTYYRAVLTCSGQSATSTVAAVTVLSPTYATLPYTQGFENTWLSRCNTNDAPDANWLNTPATGNTSWRREDDGASAIWTSPTFGAYTPTGSQGSSHSARFHSSYATAGSIGTLDLYANLSAAGTKRMTFDYISLSTGTGKLDVLLSTDGGVTFATTPLLTLSTSTTFTTQTVDLSTVSATAVIRFRGTSDYGSNDIGIDNVQLRTLPAIDIAPTALATPTSTQGCYGTETVAVTVRNQGSGTLNFATNPATVSAVVTTPGGTQTLTGSITTGTLAAGATQNVTLTPTLNMTALGTYTFAITATVTGDGNTANDVLTPAVTRTVNAPVAGTLSPATVNICQSGSTTLTLGGFANGNVQYQSSSSATGPFTNVTGATSAAFTTPTLTTTTYYRAQVTCGTNVATSNVTTVTINNPSAITVTTPVTACAGSPATLTATVPTGSTTAVRFYATATGGTPLTTTTTTGTTTTATTGNVTAATTFYAEAYVPNGSSEAVGKPSTNGADGTNTIGGLYFTATAATSIQTVTVYRTANAAAGTATIQLLTGNSTTGAVITQATVNVPANTSATVSPTVLSLNFAVPAAGQYTLYLSAATPNLCRDYSTAVVPAIAYPYNSPSGRITITDGTLAGFYYFFYNWQVGSDCANATRTPIQVNVTPLPTAGFSYPTATSCAGTATTLTPTLATGATAGTYSLPAATGLTINATTGVVTVAATAVAGTYTVTNTVSTSCGTPVTSTATFTLASAPTSGFSYTGSPFCQNGTNPTATITGTTGGTFSSTTGLTVSATTGAITLSSSTPGTYVVTYTVATPCGTSTSTQSVTITAPRTAGFTYLPASGCAGSTTPVAPVLLSGGTAGTFTVAPTTGLTVNATTGALNLVGAVAGTYTITNTVAASGGCSSSVNSATFTVNPAPTTPTLMVMGTPATGITLMSSATTGNQFYLNGNAIAGATGQTYLVNSGQNNGSYTVVVSNSFGCTATSAAVTVTVTATAPASASTSLTLYPNPTRDGQLTLELSGYRETVQLSVVNTLGQRVYAGTITGSGLSQKQALDLSGLATGVYTLQARTASGSVETRRIVRE